MKNPVRLIRTVLALTILVSCGKTEQDEARFLAPLDSITLGMKRNDVERRLPLQNGTWQAATLFSSLLGITESTLTNRGLLNLYLFYRKEGKETLLNAAVLEFSAREEPRLFAEAQQRYGTNTERLWRPAKDIRIEMEPVRNGRLKVIYDTERRHETK